MSKETALRYNEGKVQYSYVLELPKSMSELCRVFEAGAKKYSPGNWKKGGKPKEEYFDSHMRHVMAYWNGERNDPECGTHHLAHAVWNLLVYLEVYELEDNGTDKTN